MWNKEFTLKSIRSLIVFKSLPQSRPQRTAISMAIGALVAVTTLMGIPGAVNAQSQVDAKPASLNKVEITGSSIKRLEAETSLPISSETALPALSSR